VCDLLESEPDVDRNILNFERFKWGGVRRTDLLYISLDLQQFATSDRPRPTPDDTAVFSRLLGGLEELPAGTTAPRAAAHRWEGIASNRAERETVLDMLGICSILVTPGRSGFAERFVPAAERELPPYRNVERAYPACWWRAEDGVDRAAAATVGLLA
jgi:hypothetical protein